MFLYKFHLFPGYVFLTAFQHYLLRLYTKCRFGTE